MPGPQPVQYNKGGGRPLFFSKFESILLVERTMKQLNKSTFRLNGLWRVLVWKGGPLGALGLRKNIYEREGNTCPRLVRVALESGNAGPLY